MNRLEVWHINDSDEIEETVNDYCTKYELEPISVSVSWDKIQCNWCVCVVCKVGADNV